MFLGYQGLSKAETKPFARKMAAAAGAALLLGATATVGLAEDYIDPRQGADITAMCGDKPTRIGLADGNGGNNWRKQALAELKLEAAKCPNITEVIYTNAAGDPTKGNSDINSLVAQGVDILLIYPDFGDASLPALRAAKEAGVIVIPYAAHVGGTPGVDYTFNTYMSEELMTQEYADWLAKNLQKGKLLFFGGVPGNTFSPHMMAALHKALAPYPDLELLQDDYLATAWTPADGQKVATGAIAKYGKIDAVLTDFGPPAIGIMRAFQEAGGEMPYLATLATNNELHCMWVDSREKGQDWPYLAIDGTTLEVRNALRRGMAEFQGTENPEPLLSRGYVFVDTPAGLEPPCDKDLPLDADPSGLLTAEELKELFVQ